MQTFLISIGRISNHILSSII